LWLAEPTGHGSVVANDESPVVWVALTIDCADEAAQEQLRQFYLRALGGEIFNGCVRARGMLLIFRPLADYVPPTWPSAATPQQIHFEWVVPDVEGAIEYMTSIGGRLAEWQNECDPDIRVLLDPAGHPFCLIAAHSVGDFKNEAEHQVR